jgi:nuclear transport factor 2 (NTF2) superfamily protein
VIARISMETEQKLRALYASFNARDIDAVIAATSADVDWPNAWEGGRLREQAAVREYWKRQWDAIDPHVEPLSITRRGDGGIAVEVRQVVRDLKGDVIDDAVVIHVYEMADGLVTKMTVEAPGR